MHNISCLLILSPQEASNHSQVMSSIFFEPHFRYFSKSSVFFSLKKFKKICIDFLFFKFYSFYKVQGCSNMPLSTLIRSLSDVIFVVRHFDSSRIFLSIVLCIVVSHHMHVHIVERHADSKATSRNTSKHMSLRKRNLKRLGSHLRGYFFLF